LYEGTACFGFRDQRSHAERNKEIPIKKQLSGNQFQELSTKENLVVEIKYSTLLCNIKDDYSNTYEIKNKEK
ncbi:MAG: hypothetical protein MIO92_06360, partial [Methanosarcinaceae archaeon]|nr:hypothetical protein [Methanosarcinaceae archaeon]